LQKTKIKTKYLKKIKTKYLKSREKETLHTVENKKNYDFCSIDYENIAFTLGCMRYQYICELKD
jgi:hypothetical protein